jgi:hypothetical protein
MAGQQRDPGHRMPAKTTLTAEHPEHANDAPSLVQRMPVVLLIALLTGRTMPFTRPNPGPGTQALGVLEPGGATVLRGHDKHSTWVPPGE